LSSLGFLGLLGWFGLGETEFQNFQNGWNWEPQISRMGTDGGEVFVGDGGRIFDEGTDKICENDKGTGNLSSLGFLGLLGWFGLGLTAA
jgi:hypothetical protein